MDRAPRPSAGAGGKPGMTLLQFDCRFSHPDGFRLNARFDSSATVTAIFGPSGCGKTTTLALIAGLLRPDDGSIRLNERRLVDTAGGAWLPPEQREIGCVFQEQLLFPHMRVEDNLRYGLRRSASRGPSVRDLFPRVVEMLDLQDLLKRWPQTLSGGQRQRVALGRALLRGPALLLMDEPLSALDADMKHRILSYLERVVEEWHVPTLFVSHDQSDVRRLAQHIVVMEDGRVVDAGPLPETLDRAVTTRMASHPGPVNLLRIDDMRQVGAHWEGRLGGQPFHLPAPPPRDERIAYVEFLPSAVTLSRADVAGLSIRNQLHGRVREVVALTGRVFVSVDLGGCLLWAEVTPDAIRELQLGPDAPVTCLVKATAVHVMQ